MESRLRFKKFQPAAGIEPGTTRSAGQRLTEPPGPCLDEDDGCTG